MLLAKRDVALVQLVIVQFFITQMSTGGVIPRAKIDRRVKLTPQFSLVSKGWT